MAKGPARKCTKPVKQLATIDQLLAAGMKQGSAKKKDAIKKVLRLVPGWTREQCWRRIRHLRRVSRFQDPAERHPNKRKSSVEADPLRRPLAALPWTPADDGRLLNFAGYEPVKKIAQRLGRSERAVRFRLGALGMSAKVTDGWSLRGLQKILRMRHTKLRQFVGTGMIRVRDPPDTCQLSGCALRQFGHNHVCEELTVQPKRLTEKPQQMLNPIVARPQSWMSN